MRALKDADQEVSKAQEWKKYLTRVVDVVAPKDLAFVAASKFRNMKQTADETVREFGDRLLRRIADAGVIIKKAPIKSTLRQSAIIYLIWY